jgi:hypothetical protein
MLLEEEEIVIVAPEWPDDDLTTRTGTSTTGFPEGSSCLW